MSQQVLFFPMNTNHVSIMAAVARHLRSEHVFLSHDPVSDAPRYHTSGALARLDLDFIVFPEGICRTARDPLVKRVRDFRNIKRQANAILDGNRPRVLVVCIDNDPIVRAFLDLAEKKGVRTVLIQEALIRPEDHLSGGRRFDNLISVLFKAAGVHLSYVPYATGQCDHYLLSGDRAKRILMARGIPPRKMTVVGQPRYDGMFSGLGVASGRVAPPSGGKRILFAPPIDLYSDPAKWAFFRVLAREVGDAGAELGVKLHPRSGVPAETIRSALSDSKVSVMLYTANEDPLALLKDHDALVTISSTMILEALALGKECLVAEYLAGHSRLGYGEYHAVFNIESEGAVGTALRDCLERKTSPENKQRLLEDELFQLDGQAGPRTARFLEELR